MAELLGQWQYDELLARVERLGRETNMLWLRVPRQSDLNILYQAGVDKAELARQLARLWHGEAPLPERVQSFGEYAVARGLPLKWPFVTYFLFLLHPDAAVYRVYGEQLVKMWDARGDLSPSTKYTATNPDP